MNFDFINWELVIALIVMAVKVFIIINVLFLAPLILTWVERKVAGHIQGRLGPFRVGYHGLLQAVADAIKLMTKEDTTPNNADKWLLKVASVISLPPLPNPSLILIL